MVKKFTNWLKQAGFTSAVYLALFLVAVFLGKTFLSGVFLGIFVYVNFNVLKKIFKEDVVKPAEELLNKKK
jgi:hypothetical protein